MKPKDASVNLTDLLPEVSAALPIMEAARTEALIRLQREDMTITSGKDGKHSAVSLHYQGLAAHLRTKDFAQAWAAILERDLGEGWDIVVEADHLHVERDPKKKPLDPTGRPDTGALTG